MTEYKYNKTAKKFTENGHTMFETDVLNRLKRLSFLEEQRKGWYKKEKEIEKEIADLLRRISEDSEIIKSQNDTIESNQKTIKDDKTAIRQLLFQIDMRNQDIDVLKNREIHEIPKEIKEYVGKLREIEKNLNNLFQKPKKLDINCFKKLYHEKARIVDEMEVEIKNLKEELSQSKENNKLLKKIRDGQASNIQKLLDKNKRLRHQILSMKTLETKESIDDEYYRKIHMVNKDGITETFEARPVEPEVENEAQDEEEIEVKRIKLLEDTPLSTVIELLNLLLIELHESEKHDAFLAKNASYIETIPFQKSSKQ